MDDHETDREAAVAALAAYDALEGRITASAFVDTYVAMRDAMWWDDEAVAGWCDVRPSTAGNWLHGAPREARRDEHLSTLAERIRHELEHDPA